MGGDHGEWCQRAKDNAFRKFTCPAACPGGTNGNSPGIRICLAWYGHRAAMSAPDRKSTRLNSSHTVISYAVFCLKKKKKETTEITTVTQRYTMHHRQQ